MTNETSKKAVIYCRVSSIKQKTKGDGLRSQETRCREYAGYKGYIIDKVFLDDISGSSTQRPGMLDMLKYLRKNRNYPHVVLVDEISRMARGIQAHYQFRDAVTSTGASLDSPSIDFGEDPDSIFHENLMASVAQHQRQKNAEQTFNRMRARLQNGYWVFQAPVGYRYEQTKGQGKILVRDEPAAAIVQEALEGYASGRFQIQAEIQRFLESCPEFPQNYGGKVRASTLSDLLRRPIYAGYVGHDNWTVSLRKGQHEGLISFETFQKVQERLQGQAKVPDRKNLNEDFPLRGFVTCADCNHPMTSCWSKGSHARYPYYFCAQKGCQSHRKSIRRDEIEGAFENLLKQIKPTEKLYHFADSMFKKLWEHRKNAQKDRKRSLETEAKKMDKKIEPLLNRIVETENTLVINTYEKQIAKLEAKKIELVEKAQNCTRPARHYDVTFRTAMEFLSNPYKLWVSEKYEDKRTVLKLAFSDKLAYRKNEGFRTVKTTLPFKVLSNFRGGVNIMAHHFKIRLLKTL